LLESLLRVLAIENGSDNSLCLQASQSDSFAGSEASLYLRPRSRRVPASPYPCSCPFSFFVVTGTVMLDSFLRFGMRGQSDQILYFSIHYVPIATNFIIVIVETVKSAEGLLRRCTLWQLWADSLRASCTENLRPKKTSELGTLRIWAVLVICKRN
jgi:hypothetical protein